MTDEHRRAALAERAARAGGVVAREDFRSAIPVETKSDKNDVVTQADRDAQQQVVSTILQECQNDALVCEEDAPLPLGVDDVDVRETVPERGDAWVVDPIDGTANFVRGLDVWTTAVTAVVDGEPVGSAVYFPAFGDAYTAGPESVTRDGETLAVSERSDPETFVVGLLGRWDGDRKGTYDRLCHEIVDRFGDVRRLGSLQASLAYVASGALDAGILPAGAPPWDTLAGTHLVERAGGTVTDLEGDEWHHDSDGLVVSNGQAHEELLELVQAQAEP
ncbi:inositol monophosphatase [Haloarculaceae archaeon H-GB2-1]|nr:inositol monophosphatase [Haloarculaceae archaeon H-GB1-1]MEA5386167.1 inositol monophosphatase [Haloarculaceae archaeon H-GB11]MEA5407673.1 inositol monophosphatase [Haloarculaceae archaeon H-GB2-1]